MGRQASRAAEAAACCVVCSVNETHATKETIEIKTSEYVETRMAVPLRVETK
jgi:hypothetical protein